MDNSKSNFYKDIYQLLNDARKNVKKAVNLAMVYSYFEVGRKIVEEEQTGENRAQYGQYILKELAQYLTKNFGKGFSVTNLKQMRQFYLVYESDQIGQTVSDQFANLPTVSTGRKFFLSWSHYLKLMRIENIEERHFYEIEAVKNNWSLRELQRQFDSALYERLLLSKNKEGIKNLSEKGQMIEVAGDIVKDPYVLEFLGLEEKSSYSESELETHLINHLQDFLLELGTGYDENPTIGVLLCQDKDDALVELTLPKNSNIYASKYQLYLPDKGLLQEKLKEWIKEDVKNERRRKNEQRYV